jgi:hypothetical protein
MAVPKKAADRITAGFKRYSGVLAEALNRDVGESDTVVIIGDMLADLLGYKKYVEITTEFAIRGTYVDLAVKVGEDIRFLLEAKAIGSELKDAHAKQAIDYGANHGIEWIVLTNGRIWRAYKIQFAQPISATVVFEIDMLQSNPRDARMIECLGNLSREGFTQSSMIALLQQQQATSRFSIASMLLTDAVVTATRRELKRTFPSARIDDDELRALVRNDVLKREVIDGEEARHIQDQIKKANRAAAKGKARADNGGERPAAVGVPITHAPEARKVAAQPEAAAGASAADG